MYRKTVEENEVIQTKKYQKEQDDIKHIKEFIASCGTYANLVKQAKSKQKILDKMEADVSRVHGMGNAKGELQAAGVRELYRCIGSHACMHTRSA